VPDPPDASQSQPYDPATARLHEVAQPYAACVVPILGRGRKTQYASKGSGVLFGLDQPQFLLSATHVLDETRGGGILHMGVGTRIVSIAGHFVAAQAHGRGALDVAVCVFRDSSTVASPGVRWVSPTGIQRASTPLRSSLHVVIGFPHTKQASYPIDGVLDLNAMIHWGNGRDPAEVSSFGLDPSTHMLLDFEKNKITGPRGVTTSADPYGVSGGGVWSAPEPLRREGHPWELAGIAIEWRKGPEKAILATRVQHVLTLFAGYSASVAPILKPFTE